MVFIIIASCDKPSQENTLNIALPIEMIDLSPFGALDTQSTRVRNQVFDKLLTLNPKGEIIPNLAESYTYINPTTLQFTLRTNVMFHNGEMLTAEDVKYSIDKALETATLQSQLYMIQSVDVLDPYKVQITLNRIYAPIEILMTTSSTYIVSKKAGEEDNFHIGTGPYALSEWNRGQNVILKRFDGYWGTPAKIATLNIRTVPEALVRMIAVETGEVDIAYDIDYTEKERVENSKDLVFDETIINRIEYLGFTTTKAPYNNPLFREAVAYAIDIPGIIKTATLGASRQADRLTVPGIGHEPSPIIKRDIEKAKRLLKESGIPKGTKVSLLAIEGVRKSSSEIIQANLKEIGIDVEINIVEWAKYAQMMYATDVLMYMGGWSTEPDADMYYSIFFESQNIGSGGNFTRYSDPLMDKLLKQARASLDPKERLKYYNQIHAKTDKEKVLIPLYYPINTVVYRNNISNVRFDPYVLQEWHTITKN